MVAGEGVLTPGLTRLLESFMIRTLVLASAALALAGVASATPPASSTTTTPAASSSTTTTTTAAKPMKAKTHKASHKAKSVKKVEAKTEKPATN